MSLADQIEDVAADLTPATLHSLLEAYAAPPDPSFGVRSAGGASSPPTAADILAQFGGGVNGAWIIDDSISGDAIGDGEIGSEHLVDLSVTSAKLADLSVTLAKLAADSVDNSKIVDASVTATELATAAVTTTKIADDAITTPKLVALAVTTAKIDALAITTAKIAAGAITTSELAAGAVTAAKIAADTITANEIAAGAITALELATDSVTTNKIAAGQVTAAKIAANTITAAEIAADAITTSELAANAVTAENILAGEIATSHFSATATISLVSNAGATVTIDSSGITILDGKLTITDDFGSLVITSQGFAGSWLDFLLLRGYNAGWRAAPPTVGSDISTGDGSANQEPGWVLTYNSGTHVTFRHTADSSAPQGAKMRATIASGAAGDDGSLRAYFPVAGSKTKIWTLFPKITAFADTTLKGTAGLAEVYATAQFVKADKSTTTGASATSYSTLNAIDLQSTNTTDLIPLVNTTGIIPDDAGFLRVDIGFRRGAAANSAAGSVDFYEVYPQRGEDVLYLTDQYYSTTYAPTVMKQAGGRLSIIPMDASVGGSNVYTSLYLDGSSSPWAELSSGGYLSIEAGTSASGNGESVFLSSKQGFISLGWEFANPGSGLAIDSVLHATSFSTARNDYDPEGMAGGTKVNLAIIWYLTNTAGASRSVTGIAQPLDSNGDPVRRAILLINDSAASNPIKLTNADTASTNGNRFRGPGLADFSLSPGSSVWIIYSISALRWNILGF